MGELVSIIVPVYNAEAYLAKTLDSILSQTYENIELILVDDGSTDTSRNICEGYAKNDRRIKVIYQENQGVSSARNRGLENISGEYLYFIDSDDELLPNAINNFVKTMEQNFVDVVFFGWNINKGKTCKKVNSYSIKGKCNNIEHAIDEIALYNNKCGGGYPWNKFWRIKDKEKIPKFNEELFVYEDKLWVLQMLKQYTSIYFEEEAYYNYYVRKTSLSHKKVTIENCQNGIKAYEYICQFTRDIAEDIYQHALIKYKATICSAIFYAILYKKKKYIHEFLPLYKKIDIRLKYSQLDLSSYIQYVFVSLSLFFIKEKSE